MPYQNMQIFRENMKCKKDKKKKRKQKKNKKKKKRSLCKHLYINSYPANVENMASS
jgi:hypothetical protein